MNLPAFVASALSGLLTVAGWVSHRVRAFGVTPRSWACVACETPNELDRDTCWSCGAGYGQDPLYPSHIPFDRRWLCPACAVWNGIARTECWRCGVIHDGGMPIPGSGGRAHVPGSPAPGPRGPPSLRAVRRGRAEDAMRRRNS